FFIGDERRRAGAQSRCADHECQLFLAADCELRAIEESDLPRAAEVNDGRLFGPVAELQEALQVAKTRPLLDPSADSLSLTPWNFDIAIDHERAPLRIPLEKRLYIFVDVGDMVDFENGAPQVLVDEHPIGNRAGLKIVDPLF